MMDVWNLFFDLHGVLADPKTVLTNYIIHVRRIFKRIGWDDDKIDAMSRPIFARWIKQHESLNTGTWDEKRINEDFMNAMEKINGEFEKALLSHVPEKHVLSFKKKLNTLKFEHDAMLKGELDVFYPEVESVLSSLKAIKGVKIHVASSASASHVKGALRSRNIQKYIDKIIGHDTVKAPKKSLDGIYFKRMLELTHANPKHSIFIGDSDSEKKLAINLGLAFVMIIRDEKERLRQQEELSQEEIAGVFADLVGFKNFFLKFIDNNKK
ncbi:MAG: HAD family hydrolase [Promethearchaeota archaeon]